MSASFYFFDLETSGVNPRSARIMQFAGQRTDMQLKPIGAPDNLLVRLSDDVLPEPDAVLITGITPQMTWADGITEAEFLKYFTKEIALPDTTFVGFNNVRFDDEFLRFTLYRNFYDAYEWAWQDGRSRWDMLDVVRMTRALRPEGIEWPFGPDGKASNRLELLTAVNKLDHANAHDALGDVNATLAVARMIYNKQPKLFQYLLEMRHKGKVKKLVEESQPFVYCSGKYPSLYHKTTVVAHLGGHPGKQGALVYNLRVDPGVIADLSPKELAARWTERTEDETKRFPVKTLQYNRCPAVAPLSVLDSASRERLQLDLELINDNYKKLKAQPGLYQQLLAAIKTMDKQRQAGLLTDRQQVDEQLYEDFFDDNDKTAMSVVRAADSSEIGSLSLEFKDQRLKELFPLYKARNFPDSLTTEERVAWDEFRNQKLLKGGDKSPAARYFARLSELAARSDLSSHGSYLLTELQLYGEAILPAPEL